MAINSRSKGNRAERLAADLVTKWTGRKFAKTPASGGLHWKKSFVQGDIVCTKEGHFCPFIFEVKSHREINFSELLMPDKKGVKINEFWAQAVRDGSECKKIPMLLMRYDRLPRDFFFMALPCYFTSEIIGLKRIELPCSMIYHNNKNSELPQMEIFPSTHFFHLPYKEIKKLALTTIKSHYGQR